MSWNDDYPSVFWEFTLLKVDENGLPAGWCKHTARLSNGVITPEDYIKRYIDNFYRVMGVRTIDAR